MPLLTVITASCRNGPLLPGICFTR